MVMFNFIFHIFGLYPQIKAQTSLGGVGVFCCAGIIGIIIVVILLLKWIFGSKQEVTVQQQQPPQQQQPQQQPPPPKGATQERANTCPTCGQKLRYVDEYDRWYCDRCQEYK